MFMQTLFPAFGSPSGNVNCFIELIVIQAPVHGVDENALLTFISSTSIRGLRQAPEDLPRARLHLGEFAKPCCT